MVVYTAFFYGTLMHPSILRRVIGHEGGQLQICPAVVLDHTRHKVKLADYPAVLPYSRSTELFNGKELTTEEKSVRGTLVTGLHQSDIRLLDIFEGDEYTREVVPAYPLASFALLTPSSSTSIVDPSTLIPSDLPALPPLDALPEPIHANVYIWAAPTARLEPELWEFAQFIRDNAWKWVGSRSTGNTDYAEVDRRRAMNGNIVTTSIVSGEQGRGQSWLRWSPKF